jgi:hypothetical protein
MTEKPMANQNILCRGCGKTKPVTDAELDNEWKLAKESYPNITREETLNDICFCAECAGLKDDVTLHVTTRKVVKTK